MAQQNLSPQQRAMLFAQSTRQTMQTLGAKQAASENSTIVFDLPKVRLLSKILVEVDATVTLTSPTRTTIPLKPFGEHNLLRRVSLDLNNGFSPFIVEGRHLHLYNMNRLNPDVLHAQDNTKGVSYVEQAATTDGKDARLKFMIALPVTLNDRDATGLILLQNNETNVQLSIDVSTFNDVFDLNAGETASFKSVQFTPLVETFSVPPIPEAFPDISVLKLVSARQSLFSGGGQQTQTLQVGTIYRKLVLYFEDENGQPLKDADFSGNMELVFNQADVPYAIKPSMLSALNHSQLGFPLPDGVYVFDFSNQGIPNLGGARDYIDTERLTEFWVRFTPTKQGRMTAITETLSRLK